MSGLLLRIYHDHGIDRMVCRYRGHLWEDAGWHAISCTRCHGRHMWWDS
jgi:hypothetical protein